MISTRLHAVFTTRFYAPGMLRSRSPASSSRISMSASRVTRNADAPRISMGAPAQKPTEERYSLNTLFNF